MSESIFSVMKNISMMHSFIFPFLVLSIVNLFYTFVLLDVAHEMSCFSKMALKSKSSLTILFYTKILQHKIRN